MGAGSSRQSARRDVAGGGPRGRPGAAAGEEVDPDQQLAVAVQKMSISTTSMIVNIRARVVEQRDKIAQAEQILSGLLEERQEILAQIGQDTKARNQIALMMMALNVEIAQVNFDLDPTTRTTYNQLCSQVRDAARQIGVTRLATDDERLPEGLRNAARGLDVTPSEDLQHVYQRIERARALIAKPKPTSTGGPRGRPGRRPLALEDGRGAAAADAHVSDDEDEAKQSEAHNTPEGNVRLPAGSDGSTAIVSIGTFKWHRPSSLTQREQEFVQSDGDLVNGPNDRDNKTTLDQISIILELAAIGWLQRIDAEEAHEESILRAIRLNRNLTVVHGIFDGATSGRLQSASKLEADTKPMRYNKFLERGAYILNNASIAVVHSPDDTTIVGDYSPSFEPLEMANLEKLIVKATGQPLQQGATQALARFFESGDFLDDNWSITVDGKKYSVQGLDKA